MTIKVEIYGHNMDVTDRIQDYITKKVSKLDRYLTNVEETRVDLSFLKSARSASDRQVAEITVRGKGIILRAEERSDDVFAAFDEAVDKIQRRMERFKGKRQRGRGDGRPASDVAQEIEEEAPVEEEVGPTIVRRKKFALAPMDEYEAMEQMVLLGHENFFLFFNVNTNAINVLYQRRDGNYGLIEPELG